MFQQVVVKVLTTQMCVTSRSFDGKYTTGDVQKGDIESSSSQVENENILLCACLTVQTVRNGRSSGLIDDTENIKTSDRTCIFSRKTLRVVEVSRNAEEPSTTARDTEQWVNSRNDSFFDSLAELCF